MATLDFELEIGSGAAGIYPVVARAPGGEVAVSMRLPLTHTQLDQQIAVVRGAVLASTAVVRRAPTADEKPVRELGQQLFEALVTGDVRALYVTSRQLAHEQGSAADPDGLVSSARTQPASAEQAVQTASQYSSGLRLLDVGK